MTHRCYPLEVMPGRGTSTEVKLPDTDVPRLALHPLLSHNLNLIRPDTESTFKPCLSIYTLSSSSLCLASGVPSPHPSSSAFKILGICGIPTHCPAQGSLTSKYAFRITAHARSRTVGTAHCIIARSCGDTEPIGGSPGPAIDEEAERGAETGEVRARWKKDIGSNVCGDRYRAQRVAVRT